MNSLRDSMKSDMAQIVFKSFILGGKMTMRSKAFDMAEERAITKGMIANAVATVKNLMQEGSFSLEKACRMANISVEDYKKNTEK